MKRLGYYNGKYGPLEEMTIPMNDRVCWFGDGVYDAGPCRNYKIFALDEHVDRFFRNAAWLGVEMPLTKEEFKDLLNKLVHEMDSGDLFVYMQLTRAASVPRQHPYTEGPGSLWVTLNPMKIPDGRVPIKLITREDTRFFHCNIKTLNLIPAVMASEAAKQAGCDEAVLYRAPDRVTEGSHSNIHIIKDGTLYTAPLDNLILPGIARAHLLRACEALGIPYVEEPYTLEDLANADEIL
ncbi:MAG: aminotransferase class IV, partial [Clostridia bacterium]|nr:aminotransferase class IV [Clostridia bacterium]